MGVVEQIPEDLMSFYNDNYYGSGDSDNLKNTHGYSNYDYTAEHGVSWAAALIRLLSSQGAVLDIGCANGHLLKKLGHNYEIFGIEASETMCEVAEAEGIKVLGRDLLDPELTLAYAGKFDVVSSIAVFEHLRDIRAGFSSALHLLRDDGVLLFEVPLISSKHDNTVWFTSSLEHIWYPSEPALRHLVERELGYQLIGCEVYINGYGSTYIGLVVRDRARADAVRSIAARTLTREQDAILAEEQIARMQIGMIHGAVSTHADIEALVAMPPASINPMMLRRIADLWQFEHSQRYLAEQQRQSLSAALDQAQAQLQCVEGKLVALSSDSARNEIELTREIISVKEELRVVRAQLKGCAANPDADPSVTANAPALGAELKVMEVTGLRPHPFEAPGNPWPTDRPLVSVVIPSFNYGGFVEDAIRSVLDQTFRNLEVIVVEGGSSEGESRLRVAELDRTRVRVLMQGPGHRAGANRNFGISQARGKYVCCLDADDKLRPTYLEKAVFLLERHGFDVVSAALQMFGREDTIVHATERPDLEALLQANHVPTCAVFRRDLWERAGGFRDTDRAVTGYVYEDWNFWVRLAALGARIINLSLDPMLLYRVHGISLSRRSDVVPMDRQRELIRIMNADLITLDALEKSRRLAEARLATPIGNLPTITLDPVAETINAKHRPTILLAMPFLILGGAERLLSSIVGHLTASGWRVIVVTSIDPGPDHGNTTPWFEEHSPEIFHLPNFLPREFWDDFVRHLIISREVDILWVVGSAFAYDNLRSLRTEFPNLRVVDLLFNTKGHTENNRRRRHQIDLIFVENAEVRGWLLDHGETSERVRLIESGVDLDRLHPNLRSDAIRAEILDGSDDIIVCFSGRWSEEKDPLTFIEIARRADQNWPVRFVMTGAGHLEREIKRAIQGADFPSGRFQLLGAVPDLATVLASVDLLVVPSRLDGRPVVVLEALAVGTPVLASRVGGLPDLIKHGETGWLCEPGDVDAFLECLRAAVESRDKLARKRAAARSKAEAYLDVRRMFGAYESALSEVLLRKQQSSPNLRAELG
ncbi:glycosyltransferase [Microvirga calopogonii]|uniref:glycosyltransferase n=1 Tax=Microvirga calopogonii TaxID=2078013 RepID=UPI0013B38BBA|nr:glycosyltransferase [Microvirga calopogonii]